MRNWAYNFFGVFCCGHCDREKRHSYHQRLSSKPAFSIVSLTLVIIVFLFPPGLFGKLGGPVQFLFERSHCPKEVLVLNPVDDDLAVDIYVFVVLNRGLVAVGGNWEKTCANDDCDGAYCVLFQELLMAWMAS